MPPRKKKPQPRKPRTVANEEHTELEMYCIWLNEYYNSLRKAGFTVEISLGVLGMKELHPEWMVTAPTLDEVRKHLEEDED